MAGQPQLQVEAAADLLQLKLPGTAFERQVAEAASLSLDGARFMLAFFMACACGLVLRWLPSAPGAPLTALAQTPAHGTHQGNALIGQRHAASILHRSLKLPLVSTPVWVAMVLTSTGSVCAA